MAIRKKIQGKNDSLKTQETKNKGLEQRENY